MTIIKIWFTKHEYQLIFTIYYVLYGAYTLRLAQL